MDRIQRGGPRLDREHLLAGSFDIDIPRSAVPGLAGDEHTSFGPMDHDLRVGVARLIGSSHEGANGGDTCDGAGLHLGGVSYWVVSGLYECELVVWQGESGEKRGKRTG